MSNLAEENDYENIINLFNTNKPKDLAILTTFYQNIDKTEKHLRDVEIILSKCDKLRRTIGISTKDEKERFNLWLSIDNCMNYLAKYGNKDSLAVIEPYCENNPTLIYQYYDAEYTKKKITKRLIEK